MENENKNASTQNQNQNQNKNPNHHYNRKKNKKHKPKGYFIDPNGEQKAQPKSEQTSQNDVASANPTQTKPANQGNHHNNHKNNGGSASQEQKPKNEQHSNQNQGNNRNRNKHHDKRHDDRSRPQKADNPSKEQPLDKDASVNTSSDSNTVKSADRLQRPAPQKLTKFSESAEYDQYADYEEISFAELYGAEEPSTATSDTTSDDTAPDQDPSLPKVDVVGIRFKSSGKTYYFAPKGIYLRVGSHAIVETARGLEYGEVAIANTKVGENEIVSPLRAVVRKATDADTKHNAENKEKEDAAFRVCNEKIIEHKLDMKLIDAQYTFDNSKLLFYFTSSGRVDFRDLVKDLASVFRTRIELRQIGIRDEAKMVGGLGLCGRPLCCSLFLTDFGQVSIKMAKEQNLSLNSSKISGICGRLMCCLRYEHETYEYEIKRTPPVDSLVRTVDGIGVVTEINPLAATIKVKLNASPDTPPKSYKRDEVSVLRKKQEAQNS